jgi:type II secretory pathway pseudopilin PulG
MCRCSEITLQDVASKVTQVIPVTDAPSAEARNPTRQVMCGAGLLRKTDRGITYLALMFSIVLIGISVSAATRQWTVMVQREKEADLMAKGIEIQNAIALYSNTMKIGRMMPSEIYPQSLAELTRTPKPYLRRVYQDPMTAVIGSICARRPAASWASGAKAKRNRSRSAISPSRSVTSKAGKRITTGCFNIPIPHRMSMLMPPMMGLAPGTMPMQPGPQGSAPGCSADTGSRSQPLTRLRTPQYPVWL